MHPLNMTITIGNTSFQVTKTLKHCDLLLPMLILRIASVTLKGTCKGYAFTGFPHRGDHVSDHIYLTEQSVYNVT